MEQRLRGDTWPKPWSWTLWKWWITVMHRASVTNDHWVFSLIASEKIISSQDITQFIFDLCMLSSGILISSLNMLQGTQTTVFHQHDSLRKFGCNRQHHSILSTICQNGKPRIFQKKFTSYCCILIQSVKSFFFKRYLVLVLILLKNTKYLWKTRTFFPYAVLSENMRIAFW